MSPARRWLPFAGLAALLIVAAVLAGPSEGDGPPLDPTSAGRLGTKGLVEVLRVLGADVEITRRPPGPGDDTALLLQDNLSDSARRDLARWVEAGGILLVADPGSPMNPFEVAGSTASGLVVADIDRRCELPALQGVRRVSAPDGLVLERGENAIGCFPRNDGFWLVTMPVGQGEIVVVGGPGSFMNTRLDDADNGVVAAAVLAPAPGTRVVVLQPPAPGEGEEELADLVAPPVKMALLQLGVAFAFLALWRARRLGAPVLEPQPVQVPASELVVAVGNLLQRARRRGRAATLLRDDLRRDLAERLGLPPHTPAEVVAGAASVRTGVARQRLDTALAGPEPADESDLVATAQLVESVRQEVLRAQ